MKKFLQFIIDGIKNLIGIQKCLSCQRQPVKDEKEFCSKCKWYIGKTKDSIQDFYVKKNGGSFMKIGVYYNYIL